MSKIVATHGAGAEEALKVQALLAAPPQLADESSFDSIEWRANYVGPVLEGILHTMEEHWQDNQNVEL